MLFEKYIKPIWILLRRTFEAYFEDDAPRLGAALAFYTVLSLPPALMLITAILTNFLDAQTVQGQLNTQLHLVLGTRVANILESVVSTASYRPKASLGYTIIGIISALLSAMGASVQLQSSFNIIWRVRVKAGAGHAILKFFRDRLLSMVFILILGFFVVLGFVSSTVLGIVGEYLPLWISATWSQILYLGNFMVSYALFFIVFAAMFRYVPDIELRWNHVWPGALVTTALFSIGRYLIGIYLGRIDIINAYGVAGSLVLFLLFVFYSLQILFWGAEFTKIWYLYKGNSIKPRNYAVKVSTVKEV